MRKGHNRTMRFHLERHRFGWSPKVARLLVCLLVPIAAMLVACGQTSVAANVVSGTCSDISGEHHPPTALISCYITFAPTVSYAQALRVVTNLGLQPALPCLPVTPTTINGKEIDLETLWQPAGQQQLFQQEHGLVVIQTPLAVEQQSISRSWLDELKYFSSVVTALHDAAPASTVNGDPVTSLVPQVFLNSVATNGVRYTCPPAMLPSEVTPTTPVLLTDNALPIGTYAQVSFSRTTSYDSALSEVTNLGLRLADPCYEATIDSSSATTAASQPGQEGSFAKTNRLIVAVTRVTSMLWQGQTSALAGVVSVEPLGSSACAT